MESGASSGWLKVSCKYCFEPALFPEDCPVAQLPCTVCGARVDLDRVVATKVPDRETPSTMRVLEISQAIDFERKPPWKKKAIRENPTFLAGAESYAILNAIHDRIEPLLLGASPGSADEARRVTDPGFPYLSHGTTRVYTSTTHRRPWFPVVRAADAARGYNTVFQIVIQLALQYAAIVYFPPEGGNGDNDAALRLLVALGAFCVLGLNHFFYFWLHVREPGYLVASLHGRDPDQPRRAESSPSYCAVCDIARPPRAGHCRHCGRCVREFDHHCVWLGVCIGQRNKRLFVYFLLSTNLSFLCGAVVMWIQWLDSGPITKFSWPRLLTLGFCALQYVFLLIFVALLEEQTFKSVWYGESGRERRRRQKGLEEGDPSALEDDPRQKSLRAILYHEFVETPPATELNALVTTTSPASPL